MRNNDTTPRADGQARFDRSRAGGRATRSRALLDQHQAEATRALAATVPEPHRQEEPAYAPPDRPAPRLGPTPTTHPDAPRGRQAGADSGHPKAQRPSSAAIEARQRDGTWVDYQTAEAELFKAMSAEFELIARDHAHHFGAEVGELASEVAEAAYSKAAAYLTERGQRRVFSEATLARLLKKWAAYWCDHHARRKQTTQSRQRNAADRKGYIRRRYGDEAAAAKGRQNSLTKRRALAIPRARQAAALRTSGWSLARIGQALNASKRTIQRDLSNNSERLQILTQALPLFRWTFGKEVSGTDPKSLVPSTRQQLLPNAPPNAPTERAAQADPINAAQSLKADQHDQMEAIGQALPDLLRAYWAETDQAADPDPPRPSTAGGKP